MKSEVAKYNNWIYTAANGEKNYPLVRKMDAFVGPKDILFEIIQVSWIMQTLEWTF